MFCRLFENLMNLLVNFAIILMVIRVKDSLLISGVIEELDELILKFDSYYCLKNMSVEDIKRAKVWQKWINMVGYLTNLKRRF